MSHATKHRPKARILIVEDHIVVAEGLQRMLASHYTVVGTVHRGDAVLPFLENHVADAVTLDLQLPGTSGHQLIPELRKRHPKIAIIVLTMHSDRTVADAALSCGASAFVPKSANADELRAAIETALKGDAYRSKLISRARHRTGLDAAHPGLQHLTPRQEQIMLMLGEGVSAKEIAQVLGVHQSTITFHKHNIMSILGLDTDGAFMRLAVLLRAAADDKDTRST